MLQYGTGFKSVAVCYLILAEDLFRLPTPGQKNTRQRRVFCSLLLYKLSEFSAHPVVI